MAKITITGLKRPRVNLPHIDERDANKTRTDVDENEDTETLIYESSLPPAWSKLDASQLPQELAKLGYEAPTKLESLNEIVKLKVVSKDAASCYDASAKSGLCIREDESFASWWTTLNGGHKDSEITTTADSVSVYGTTTTFERTLRVPDSGKHHRLPPGMGHFPIVPVKRHEDKVPDMVRARGGYMIPMYQREALWLRFSHQPNVLNALKISVGGINALTGAKKGEAGKPGVQDYLCKSQPWLDGIVKEEGKVRQFVAMPVGQGYTIEEQLTGENTEATLQIDVFPAFRRDLEVKVEGESIKNLLLTPEKAGVRAGDYVHVRPRTLTGGYDLECLARLHGSITFKAIYEERRDGMRSTGGFYGAGPVMSNSVLRSITRGYAMAAPPAAKQPVSMGIAAGGSITQQIDKDSQDPEIYDFKAGKRIYIHFINAGAWKSVTGQKAPVTPVDKKAYKDNDLPWFDLYNEPEPAKDLGAGFDRIRSVKDIDEQDNVEWKDVNAADVRKCSKCGNEKIQGNDDEALFDERWKDGKEGRIVDIDASAPSRILFNTKLPFVHINKPKPQHRKCRCAPGPANTSAGKSEWTYELDNVSPLTK